MPSPLAHPSPARALTAVALLLLAGCLSTDSLTHGSDDDAGADAPHAVDAATKHDDAVTHDTATKREAAPPVCTRDAHGYSDITDPVCWETYDISGMFGDVTGFAGAAFDGRYVYFAPDGGSPFVRYDTMGAGFADATSWTGYQPAADQGVADFSGAVYDGRYVFYVAVDAPSFLRYDTHAPFGAAASWASEAPQAANGVDYNGGTFDGRYIYYAPNDDAASSADSGLIARYDTQGDFTNETASWSFFDVSQLPGEPEGFSAIVFDGTYAYFTPNSFNTVMVRYDTTSSFTANSSWTVLDLTTITPAAAGGYLSAGFDGTNLYLTPASSDTPAFQFPIARASDFTDATAWSAFYPGGLAGNGDEQGYLTTAFDGRFIFLCPFEYRSGSPILRYDTSTVFSNSSSWSYFDASKAPLKTGDFGGAVFDGEYLYLAPFDNSTFVRFDAKTPPSQPKLPDYYGSFF